MTGQARSKPVRGETGTAVGVRLERYREIVPDWEAFLAACSRPLPTTIRAQTTRIRPEALAARLADRGLPSRAIAWAPGFLDVSGSGVGKTIEHWMGFFYVQEIVQALPVLALDPQPGEAVLDLCAAPGGKATHAADRMSHRGLLVANEPNGRRAQALLANLNRMGTTNVAVTEYAGESFPLGQSFDRVLVDAPCSAEGTLRREGTLRQGAYPTVTRRMGALQRRLILRAYELVRPGGVLVYSTCTFAPEENEAVVSFLLGERDASPEPIGLPIAASPGLREWGESRFSEGVEQGVRVYPHQLDSGGGFLARFRKPSR